jgi:parvulin-like peptidyl-prolyl isomerase
MVEAFDRAVFALSVGELSGIVVTPFGYHLIQLVDRTEPSLVEFEQIAPQLTPYLRDQRVGEKIASLTRELRERADISVPERAD